MTTKGNEQGGRKMLILSRKLNEKVVIKLPDGAEIVVAVFDRRGRHFRIGIEAPKEVTIHREEIWRKIAGRRREENAAVAS